MKGGGQADEEMGEEDEGGYETYSEEDVSDDEKDNAKMSWLWLLIVLSLFN